MKRNIWNELTEMLRMYYQTFAENFWCFISAIHFKQKGSFDMKKLAEFLKDYYRTFAK